MIIDAILDREDGWGYDPISVLRYMYDEATIFGFDDLERAIDGGSDSDVVRELCSYVEDNGYNPEIFEYVRSVRWVPSDIEFDKPNKTQKRRKHAL